LGNTTVGSDAAQTEIAAAAVVTMIAQRSGCFGMRDQQFLDEIVGQRFITCIGSVVGASRAGDHGAGANQHQVLGEFSWWTLVHSLDCGIFREHFCEPNGSANPYYPTEIRRPIRYG